MLFSGLSFRAAHAESFNRPAESEESERAFCCPCCDVGSDFRRLLFFSPQLFTEYGRLAMEEVYEKPFQVGSATCVKS